MPSTLSTLLPYLIRYRWRYVAGLAALVLKSLLAVTIPLTIKFAIDALTDGSPPRVLYPIVGALLGLGLAKAVCQFYMRWILIGASREVEYDIRNDLTAHLLRLPQRFFRVYRTGDLMSRAVNDLAQVRMLFGPGLMYSLDVSLTMSVVLVVMAATDWRLTCLVFLPAPLVSLTVSYFGRRSHERFQAIQSRLADISALVQQNLSNMRVVRAYAQNAAETERFQELNQGYLDENLRLVELWKRFYPRMELLVALTYVFVLGFGGRQVLAGSLSLGSFVFFLLCMAILTWPMIGLGWVVNIVQRGTAALERINEIMAYPPLAVEDSGGEPALQAIRGDLELRDVSYNYPDADRTALEAISLYLAAGSTTAIVGSVGAGKTSLLNLIPRLADPNQGAVLVDGVDVRQAPIELLREAIGFVPQESFLFSRSIEANLRLGAESAEDWQLEEAASIAHVWDEIQSFPDGLGTAVGERGVTLSGGQKQRVCLARALLRDPRILILDDALSSVDAVTEAAILERLRQFMRNRTTLIVSHRVSAARFADTILVLEHGRLVEQGSHQELVAQGGRYAALYRRQMLEEEIVGDE